MNTNVGSLRQQTALSSSNRPVIIVSNDPELMDLEAEEFYPDTTNGDGRMIVGGTFKIKVKRKEFR